MTGSMYVKLWTADLSNYMDDKLLRWMNKKTDSYLRTGWIETGWKQDGLMDSYLLTI